MAERSKSSSGGKGSAVMDALPTDKIGDEFQHLLSVLADKALSKATDVVGGATDKLSGVAEGSGAAAKAVGKAGEKTAEGKSPLMAGLSGGAEAIKSKVSDAFGGKGGGKGGGKKIKVTNIIEQIDVGAPVRVVYDQWTQFQDFSNFMKKVEGVDQKEDPKLTFKAQILWSHRTWEATIIEQVPDQRIVWRSSGDKGHVDGAVTFHELGPELTRVLVVLEYHPQGLFERTGNIWRAQGRRARLELKHFRRHVMTQTLLHPDDVDGWRGEIHDSKVTLSDEDARSQEDDEAQDDDAQDDGDSDYENEYEDEADEDEDEADEGDAEEDDAEEEDDDAQEDEEDEESEDDREPRRRSRSRARSGRR